MLIFSPIFLFPQTLPEAGLVYSQRSAYYFGKENKYETLIDNWELYLIRNSIPFTIIDDEELDDFDFRSLSFLICPELISLSSDATENIKKFLSEGKGIYITGIAGSYNEEGQKKSENLVTELFGDTPQKLNIDYRENFRIKFLRTGLMHRSVSENSELLLGANLQLYFLPASFSNNDAVLSTDYSKSLLRIKEFRGGRILWTGFHPYQFIGSRNEQPFFNSIINNSFEWLSGKPGCWIDYFPNQQVSAGFLFALNSKKNLVEEISDSFSLYNMPVIFFEQPDSTLLPTESYLLWNETDYFNMSDEDKAELFRNTIHQNYSDNTSKLVALTYYPALEYSPGFYCKNGADYIFDLDRKSIISCKSIEKIRCQYRKIIADQSDLPDTDLWASWLKSESDFFAIDITDVLRYGESSQNLLITLLNNIRENEEFWLTDPVNLIDRLSAINSLTAELVSKETGKVTFSISANMPMVINTLKFCFTLPPGADNILCYDDKGKSVILFHNDQYYSVILKDLQFREKILIRVSFDEKHN